MTVHGLDECYLNAEGQLHDHFPGERACADCETYAHASSMVTKADGRVICRSCQTKLDRSAAEKAQANLFVEQKGLFQ